MKIISIEPTPSPNSMKLILNETLPDRETRNFNENNAADAPEYAKQLLAINGVKGLYHVADFIALERNGKVDWPEILPKVRQLFSDDSSGNEAPSQANHDERVPTKAFGAVNVWIQMFRGIPMQIKLSDGDEEKRVALPERFSEAVMKVSEVTDSFIFERQWVEQGARYGQMDEIGEAVREEIDAAYDKVRLAELVKRALAGEHEMKPEKTNRFERLSVELLDDPNWKNRYAALERIDPEAEDLPALKKALKDEKMSIRRLAVVYLGMIGSEALPLLYDAMKDRSVTVRRTAGDCLSDIGDPDAIGVMCEALKDSSRIVRWRAAMFLYEVGDESALPALKTAADDPQFEVQMQVRMAIERIEKGKQAMGSVWKQMTDNLK
ncbi:MAG TPA: virulence factor [Bacillales bacterium]|nr:virulence factor [Bacillales bacterium]